MHKNRNRPRKGTTEKENRQEPPRSILPPMVCKKAKHTNGVFCHRCPSQQRPIQGNGYPPPPPKAHDPPRAPPPALRTTRRDQSKNRRSKSLGTKCPIKKCFKPTKKTIIFLYLNDRTAKNFNCHLFSFIFVNGFKNRAGSVRSTVQSV